MRPSLLALLKGWFKRRVLSVNTCRNRFFRTLLCIASVFHHNTQVLLCKLAFIEQKVRIVHPIELFSGQLMPSSEYRRHVPAVYAPSEPHTVGKGFAQHELASGLG
jgi:hypothetical protein